MRKVISGRERAVMLSLAVALMLALAGGVLAFEGRIAHAGGTGGGGGGLCQPATGQPSCHFSGFSTGANFVQVNDSPDCQFGPGFLGFSVFIAQNVTHDPPTQPADRVLAIADVSTFDCVTGAFQLVSGSISDADLKMTGVLDTASLDATIPATDFNTGAPATITFSLRWQGVGTVNQTVSNEHTRTEGLTVLSHFVGDSRLAVVSGTFSDGTNSATFTSPTDMISSKGGTVEVLRQ